MTLLILCCGLERLPITLWSCANLWYMILYCILCVGVLCCGAGMQAVCNKCGIDTFNSQKQSVWLCKICSENREVSD